MSRQQTADEREGVFDRAHCPLFPKLSGGVCATGRHFYDCFQMFFLFVSLPGQRHVCMMGFCTDNRNDLELDISNEYRIAQFQSRLSLLCCPRLSLQQNERGNIVIALMELTDPTRANKAFRRN